ncbi:DUF916 domain-containing protein [Margalitia sp. FSL K6-0131]|uniref:DUF916 domain-containing protein n=1 Tax=Margalitia sp. FSL K6-0131 TaxID=2954604 RepID=UPI0030FADE85
MKLYKSVVLTILVICMFTVTTGFSKNASDNNQQSLPFSVSLNLPQNQVEGVKSYFDLNVRPNTTQKLSVLIKNLSSKEITVNMMMANALNSPQSGIIYQKERKNDYARLIDRSFYMDQYIEVPETIKLKPFETKKTEIKVNIPDKKGVLLGGLLFNQKEDNKKKVEKTKNDVSVKGNIKIGTAIAIQLNYPKKERQVPLNIIDASNQVFLGGSFVNFQLTNKNADLIKNVSYDYKVMNSKDNKTLFKGKIQPFNVAPKSEVKMRIPWEGKTIESGQYKLVLHETNSNNEIEKPFEIERTDVKEYAKATNQKVSTPFLQLPWYTWGGGSLLLVCIVIFAYRFGKKKNKQSNTESEGKKVA